MVERGKRSYHLAQSIGEPGTQLTMRTFHIGGAALVSASNRPKTPRATICPYACQHGSQQQEELIA